PVSLLDRNIGVAPKRVGVSGCLQWETNAEPSHWRQRASREPTRGVRKREGLRFVAGRHTGGLRRLFPTITDGRTPGPRPVLRALQRMTTNTAASAAGHRGGRLQPPDPSRYFLRTWCRCSALPW